MKSVAITGPPGSGKTTFWKAMAGGRAVGEVATVAVPDARLDKLTELHKSRKTVNAQLEVLDIHSTARTAAAATAKLRNVDALVLVLPGFGGQAAGQALAAFRDDLILADMAPIETRLSRARKDPAARKEVPALEAAAAVLGEGEFLDSRKWERDELKTFSALALITLKPLIVVENVDEDQVGVNDAVDSRLKVSALLEAEVAGLPPDEAADLLGAYGVTEPLVGKVVEAVYRSLDLITFFTTGDDESRAWEVPRGATAPQAAGAIHSDIQRGFIRAEVATYDNVVKAGSWDAAKAQSLIRVEGKDYIFQEGDVTNFRFAV
jgi:ribosome-binding ATPase YchF (GTP1/OBG family)